MCLTITRIERANANATCAALTLSLYLHQRHREPQVKSIDGRARTVRELLDKAKYAIDFYQREYAWQERQVRELIDDLTGKFLDWYDAGHARHEAEGYGHCFLGSVVISHKRGQRFIVDGQQRLTTLTLLLIHLHHLQAGLGVKVDLQNLVYSEKYRRKSFNLDVPDRAPTHATADGWRASGHRQPE